MFAQMNHGLPALCLFTLATVRMLGKYCSAAAIQDPKGNLTEADFYTVVPIVPPEIVNRVTRADPIPDPPPYGYRPGSATETHSCQNVRAVPAELRSGNVMKPDGLDNFYQKYTEAYGIPVLSSSAVPDKALKRACYTLRFLLASHAGIRQSFYRMSGRVAVIGKDEGTTSIPEHSYLDDWWNQRARGLGATAWAPVCSGGEENVLCYTEDRYHNQDIFLHETSHGVHLLGAAYAIPGWDDRLRSLYEEAKSIGLWDKTYSMSTPEEYFAEGTQSYFNVNAYEVVANGVYGPISTREKLINYDPKLYNLIREVFPCDNVYLKRCESTRARENSQQLEMNCDYDGGTSTDKPVTPDTSCNDYNEDCGYWESIGECTNNPGYMEIYCQLSCKVCTGASSNSNTNCIEDNGDCASWAHNGECSKNPQYMNYHCMKSCGLC